MTYKLKSVKLWAGISLFILGTTFAFLMGASFRDWSEFSRWVFGLLVFGNVASKMRRPL